jgi:hypothetical protein
MPGPKAPKGRGGEKNMLRLADLVAELRSLKIDLLHKVLLAIIVMLALLFWLTPYSYHTGYGNALIRINRLSGRTYVLYAGSGEWRSVMTPKEAEAAAEEARAVKKAKAELEEKFFKPKGGRYVMTQEEPAQ